MKLEHGRKFFGFIVGTVILISLMFVRGLDIIKGMNTDEFKHITNLLFGLTIGYMGINVGASLIDGLKNNKKKGIPNENEKNI